MHPLAYYKKREVQQALAEHAADREIAVRYNNIFGKRPDCIKTPRDVFEFAKQGATSFHCSEERWSDILKLSPELKRSQLDELRIGWDLVLDIDCSVLEYSKIAASLLIDALSSHGIRSISCKFSGNRGFHIGIPFEAFPKQIKKEKNIHIKTLFPEGPRKIALYLFDIIKEGLKERILRLEKRDIQRIALRLGKEKEHIVIKRGSQLTLAIERFISIDTALISSRHLFRMPYSLHESSGLVSLPLDIDSIESFRIEDAHPARIKDFSFRFLNREARAGEAAELFDRALFFQPCEKKEHNEIKEIKELQTIPGQPEANFPPCIKRILAGLEDGRKRSLFILTNFLKSVGWSKQKIIEKINEWNKRNKEPLRQTIINSHIRYHLERQRKQMLPPNCSNEGYYKDIGLCSKDALCAKISNPVNYTLKKGKIYK